MAAKALSQAAAARHRRAVARAEQALRDLGGEGAPVSFQSVARRAGVSRQWLYTQPAVRSEIERLRDQTRVVADGIPARQRASEASLRERNRLLLAENRRRRDRVVELTAELAIACGQRRAEPDSLATRAAGTITEPFLSLRMERAGAAPESAGR